MNFNFKKNNLIIILLLIFVILSCIVYINMLNFKEGLTELPLLRDQIKYYDYVERLPDQVSDPSFAYYRLKAPTSKVYKLRNIDIVSSFSNLTDFSMTNASYSTISDASFISTHKRDGMFSVSDASYTQFYGYFNNNSAITLNLDISNVSERDSSYNLNVLFKELSGNIYDPSAVNRRLNYFQINIFDTPTSEAKQLINLGKFVLTTATGQPSIASVQTQVQTASGGLATATGNTVTIGNTSIELGALRSLFGRGDPNLDSELFAYLLQNGTLGSSYVPPIYNNFETAMNLPSNPIANPINSMNPLEYAETLFGPNITPLMAKNSYLNQSTDTKVESSGNTTSTVASQLPKFDNNGNILAQNSAAITSQLPKFDNNGNLLAQNSAANVSDNTNTKINTKSSISTEDYPPCPAPQRCPEPNFECKKIPKYEQGIDNAFLPRPVLTDFSTFGM